MHTRRAVMMPRCASLAAVVAALTFFSWVPCHARNPKDRGGAGQGTEKKNYLAQAQEKYRELDYQALPALLAEALLQPDLRREDYVEIYKLQGFTYTVLGDPSKAREAFIRLLVVDPGFEMDSSVSPRFRGVFAEVLEDFKAHGDVSMTHNPPTTAAAGDGVAVEVTVVDLFGRVKEVTGKVRAVMCGRAGAYVSVVLPGMSSGDGERTFKGHLPDPAAGLPGDNPSGYDLEYQLSFSTQAGDSVEVSGVQPDYRVTVGDPRVAALTECQPVTPKNPRHRAAAAADEGGSRWSLVGLLLGGGAAGALAVGAVVVLGLVGSGGGAVASLMYCNFNRVTCGWPNGDQRGSVKVTVDKGGTP